MTESGDNSIEYGREKGHKGIIAELWLSMTIRAHRPQEPWQVFKLHLSVEYDKLHMTQSIPHGRRVHTYL